jgi:UMF1 family MFS transporter
MVLLVYSNVAGGLYANSEVKWGCFPKGIGILSMFLLVPIFAGIGNLFFLWLSRRFHISSKSVLVWSIIGCAVVPAYGLIGFGSDTIGVRQGWEMMVVGCVYGFFLGPLQAFARSIFASLIPHGKESAFYSFYELTNRGSSALGPLVLTAIQQSTGDLRYGFIFVVVNLVLPAVALQYVDLAKGKREAEKASPQGIEPPRPMGATVELVTVASHET